MLPCRLHGAIPEHRRLDLIIGQVHRLDHPARGRILDLLHFLVGHRRVGIFLHIFASLFHPHIHAVELFHLLYPSLVLLPDLLLGWLLAHFRPRRPLPGFFDFLDGLRVDVLGEIGSIKVFQPVTDLFLRRELEEVLESVPLVEGTIDRLVRVRLRLGILALGSLPARRPGRPLMSV